MGPKKLKKNVVQLLPLDLEVDQRVGPQSPPPSDWAKPKGESRRNPGEPADKGRRRRGRGRSTPEEKLGEGREA